MKAITICQPYAHLIALRDDDDRAKRVENRTWATHCRGDLLIHAGKSREWLGEGTIPDRDCNACKGTGFVDADTGRSIVPGVGWSGMNMAAECGCGVEADERYGIPIESMAFGAVVAVARLSDCFALNLHDHGVPEGGDVRLRIPPEALRRRPWLASHEHVHGPWCWVLSEVRPLPEPIAWRGSQGLWDAPAELVAEVNRQLAEVAPHADH